MAANMISMQPSLPSLLSPIPGRLCFRHINCVRSTWISSSSRQSRVLHLCPLAAMPLEPIQEMVSNPSSPQLLYDLAGVDAQTAGLLKTILGPLCAVGQILMIVRIVLTWYPEIDQEKMPWLVACAPTEPILGPTRKVIPPAFGVDVSPIVWVAVLSFVNEVLLGPQGILSLIEKKG